MDDKKVGRPDISLREIANQLKKNAEGQHKDFLAGAVLNRKELNDLEQGINRLNKNLEKLTKIISSSSMLEKSTSIQSKGARRFSGGTAEVVTNPQMGRMLREDKRAVNVKDLFGNYINKDSRSPDNFFFQSGSQARQREELRIKLKKGEIDQEEYDKSNEQIGKAGGFKDFFKDFKAGLQDVSNFFTNKNVIQTEESLKKSEEKQKEITPQADKKNEVLDKILGEVNTIRKILENNLKKPKSEGRERRKSEDVIPGTDIAVIRRKPIVKRNLLGDSSNVIDVAAKEVKKPLLLSGPSGPSQVQSSSVPVSPAPTRKDSDALDVEPKPAQEQSSSLLGDVSIAGGSIFSKAAKGLGSVAKFAGSTGGKLLGGAAAVGLGAYTAYQGYTEAEENKQASLKEIEAKIKTGEITAQSGEELKKQVADQATENKGGAIGKGTGMAAGALGGAVAGAKLGAFFGPAGVAVGGLAGGALGAFSGSEVGQNIGGVIGKGVAGIKGLFGKQDTELKSTQGAESNDRSKAISEYQTSEKELAISKEKIRKFEEENPFDYREKPTSTQEFLGRPGTGKFKDPKKQAEYDKLVQDRESSLDKMDQAKEKYQVSDQTQEYKTTKSGNPSKNLSAPFKKLEALTDRMGYKKEEFLNDDGKTYNASKINAVYEKEMTRELSGKENQTNMNAKQSSVEAAKKSENVTPLSEENSTLKEKNANRPSNTVINNVSQAPAQEASSAVGSAPTTRPPNSSLEKYLDRQAVFA